MAVCTSNYYEAVQKALCGKAPRSAGPLWHINRAPRLHFAHYSAEILNLDVFAGRRNAQRKVTAHNGHTCCMPAQWLLTHCEALSGDAKVHPSSSLGFHIVGWEYASTNKTMCSTVLCTQWNSATPIMMAGFSLNN